MAPLNCSCRAAPARCALSAAVKRLSRLAPRQRPPARFGPRLETTATGMRDSLRMVAARRPSPSASPLAGAPITKSAPSLSAQGAQSRGWVSRLDDSTDGWKGFQRVEHAPHAPTERIRKAGVGRSAIFARRSDVDDFEPCAQGDGQAGGGSSDGRRALRAVYPADDGPTKGSLRAAREGNGKDGTRGTSRERQAGGRRLAGRPVVGGRTRDQRGVLVQRRGDQTAAPVRIGGREQEQVPALDAIPSS